MILNEFADKSTLPDFGLQVTIKKQAYDKDGHKIPFAVYEDDFVVDHLIFSKRTED